MKKRIISLMLILVMAIGFMPTVTFAANNDFAGGSGTEEDPYLISTPKHLDNVRYYLSNHFKMMNDIDLTEGTAKGGEYNYNGNGWNPIGSEYVYGNSGRFIGIFDGNGFTVTGMNIDVTRSPSGSVKTLYLGLFANNAGTIKNLRIEGAFKTNVDLAVCVGGISAVNSGIITSCANEAEIIIKPKSYAYDAYAGGISGENSGTIQNCYNAGMIKSSGYAERCCIGGICGYGNGGSVIENCYNTATIYSYYAYESNSYDCFAGGIQGYTDYSANNSYIKTCYNIGKITTTSYYWSSYGNNRSITYSKSNTYVKVENCFYLDDTGGSCTGAKSLNATLIKNPSALTGFDFDVNWTMGGKPDYNYAELQCFEVDNVIGFSGNVAYLSIIESDISKIGKKEDGFLYEWIVDEKVVSTDDSYIPQSDDIGKKLKIKVVGIGTYNKGTYYSKEVFVSKAVQSSVPVVPAAVFSDDNSFEITTVPTQEYSIDNINWQTSGVFENLDPNKEYIVYSRILENDLYLLGESTEVLKITTERRPVTGIVNIVGTSRYGDTLTADVSAVGPKGATYSYEWKSNGVTVGQNSTYKITQNDIGKNITLSVNGTDDYIGSLTSAAVTATKATAQLPNAPVVETVTNTSVKLVEKSGYEYSMNKTTWQDSTLFENLSAATEYTFYQRIKETDTTFASKSSSGTKATTLKNTVAAPAVPIVENITNKTVTLKKMSGYEYSKDGLVWQQSNVFDNLSPFTEYSFCQRIAETATDYASAQSGYTLVTTLKNTVNAPAAPIIESATETSVTLKAISGYQYSINGTTWQSSTVFSGLETLKTYTFYQRIAETETDYASGTSKGTSFKVKYITSKPAKPVLDTITNNSITVKSQANHQYSIDGENWSNSAVFTNLQPNTQYSVYCKIQETDTHYASEGSTALVVKTLKNTVAKPSAPSIVETTNSSVTLGFNSSYEYSVDGENWQESNVFTNLDPNTKYSFVCRVKETDVSYVSEVSDATSTTTLKNSVATPSAPTIEKITSDSIILVAKNGYEYSKDGDNWQTSNIFTNLQSNKQYSFYQRVAETDISYVSEKSTALTVTTLKISVDAPNAPTVEKITPVSITLVATTGYEYSIDGSTWQTSNIFEGLKANTKYTFYQRIAETDTTYASEASNKLIVTTAPKQSATSMVLFPVVTECTTNSITVAEIEGYEYSLNGSTWQNSGSFTGLSSNTTYTVYQRSKETESDLAGTSKSATAKTLKTGTSSYTYFDRLVNYINQNGTTSSDGYKTIIVRETKSSTSTYYYMMQVKNGTVFFEFLPSNSSSSYIVSPVEFTLTRNSKYISTYFSVLYYYGGSCVDAVATTKSIDRSLHTKTTNYSLGKSGKYISAENFSTDGSLALRLLLAFWDNHMYSNLGFGFAALGFTSYSGYGSKSCDIPSSYHTGSSVVYNKRSATCLVDGYTGDTYCSVCNEKKYSGQSITSTSSHKFDNACDEECNICKGIRKISHTYTNDCDASCNVCSDTRTVPDHVYTNNCDTDCNICGNKRTIIHTYDNSCDVDCNICNDIRTITHTYDNACDDTCNVCKTTRVVPDHVYNGVCDGNCNVCGLTRTVPAHTYDNNCDTACNVCGAARTISHKYDNNCDTSCNVCGATRTITHTFGEYFYDDNATETADGTKTRSCSVCGHKETITAEGTKLEKTLIDTSLRFTDVPATAWYKQYVDYSVTFGIFNGTTETKFSPAMTMTRAQFVQVLANVSGVDTSNKNVATAFSDVGSGKWFTPAVKWASDNGIVTGVGNGRFAPNDNVTREQMCVMLVRYAANKGLTLKQTQSKANFADDSKIGSWAKDAVYTCQMAEIVGGKGNNMFDPKATGSRSEAATIFTRFHKNYIA